MLGLLPCLLSRLSLTSLLKFHQCGSRVVDFAYKLKEINLRLITRRKINMSHAFSIWALQKIRPRPRGVKMKMCRFSSTGSGGKVANAALPLLTTAVKLQVPVFLLSQRRKTCKCRFTAAHNGGKAANAGFPPLREEEKLFNCSFAAS